MKRTSLFLTDKQLKQLEAMAAKNGVSVALLVRLAIDRFIAESRKKGGVKLL